MHSLANLVTKWSEVRGPQSINWTPFWKVPSISLKLWTAAYLWIQLKRKVLDNKNLVCRLFHISSAVSGESITLDLLQAHKEHTWTTLSDFQERRYRIYTIRIAEEHSACMCSCFVKDSQCKHTLGMKMKMQIVNVRREVKTVHPTRIRKALIIQ